MRRYEISDQAWHRVWALLPGKTIDVGRTAKDNRQFLNAVLWIARSGAPWRDLPERFGPWNWSLPTLSTLGEERRLATGI
jgi:putative transposase